MFFLIGCSRNAEVSLFAMDTSVTINADCSTETMDLAVEEIYALEKELSAIDEGSALHKLNQNGGGGLTGNLAEILPKARDISQETGGAFDCTLYKLSEAWGMYGQGGFYLPETSAVNQALEHTGYKNMAMRDGELTLLNGVKIDLGGIAKGYALNKCAEILRADCSRASLNMGGDVIVIGSRPDGLPWNVGIRDPRGAGVFAKISVQNTAVVTSGDYERYFVKDGVRYHHIFDSKTGYPAAKAISATVVMEDAAYADAYCTALFVMGASGIDFMSERGISALVVDKDKRVFATEKMKSMLTILNGEYVLNQ